MLGVGIASCAQLFQLAGLCWMTGQLKKNTIDLGHNLSIWRIFGFLISSIKKAYGIEHYLKIIRVKSAPLSRMVDPYPEYYVPMIHLFGWGFPIIVTTVSVWLHSTGIDVYKPVKTDTNGENFKLLLRVSQLMISFSDEPCWLAQGAFIVTWVIPFVFMIVWNLFIFGRIVAVIMSLHPTSPFYGQSQSNEVSNLFSCKMKS